MKPADVPEPLLLTALRAASDWPVNTLEDSPPDHVEFMRLGLAAVLTADSFACSRKGVVALAVPIHPINSGADSAPAKTSESAPDLTEGDQRV